MKTEEDLKNFVKDGITMAAVYWQQTYGFPLELFQKRLKETCPTFGHQMILVSNLYKRGILKKNT